MAWSGSLAPQPLTLAPCFVNNDYVTAEITYSTAHACLEVRLAMGCMVVGGDGSAWSAAAAAAKSLHCVQLRATP